MFNKLPLWVTVVLSCGASDMDARLPLVSNALFELTASALPVVSELAVTLKAVPVVVVLLAAMPLVPLWRVVADAPLVDPSWVV
jgi:hypothetical protein